MEFVLNQEPHAHLTWTAGLSPRQSPQLEMLIWCSYITFLRKKEIRVSMKCIILYVTNTLYFPPKSWAIITEMQIILRYSFSLLQKMSKTQKVQQYTLDEALEEPVPLHIARRNTGVSQVVQWVRNLPAMQETPV